EAWAPGRAQDLPEWMARRDECEADLADSASNDRQGARGRPRQRAAMESPYSSFGEERRTEVTPVLFGRRLRELRTARGWSLSELARRIFYSKGYVSRVETGASRPSVEFARRCDVDLEADGALVALVSPTAPEGSP